MRYITPHNMHGSSLRIVSADGLNRGLMGRVDDFRQFQEHYVQEFLDMERLESGWVFVFADDMAARLGIFQPQWGGYFLRADTKGELISQIAELYGD